ncbi:MAG: hypothetical protein HY728_04005 [Candidatus Rokubacteria bacterium]|nr:hypothetical protein [Candidatus Rokubacteria bacterium]
MTPHPGMTAELARELYGLQPRSEPSAPGLAAARRARQRGGPHCASPLIHRELPVDWFERWAQPLGGWRPSRCLDCGRRFHYRSRLFRSPIRLRRGASPIPPALARD